MLRVPKYLKKSKVSGSNRNLEQQRHSPNKDEPERRLLRADRRRRYSNVEAGHDDKARAADGGAPDEHRATADVVGEVEGEEDAGEVDAVEDPVFEE